MITLIKVMEFIYSTNFKLILLLIILIKFILIEFIILIKFILIEVIILIKFIISIYFSLLFNYNEIYFISIKDFTNLGIKCQTYRI